MALWNGTTFNNNKLASMTNSILWPNATSLTKRKCGFFYAVMGKKEVGSIVDGAFKIPGVEEVTGLEHKIRFQGKVRTIPTVSDGANEVTTPTNTYVSDTFGAISFPLTHYIYREPIPESDWTLIRGKEAETQSYIQDVINMLAESVETQLANDMLSTGAQTRTALGGLETIVEDGNTWGLDRSDAANADHRSIVDDTAGDLDFERVGTMQNRITVAGGSGALGLLSTTEYTSFQALVRNQLHAMTTDDWDKFGGQFIKFANTIWVLEQRIPTAGEGFILSPEFWKIVKNSSPVNEGGIKEDPTMVDGYSLKIRLWIGLFCRKCNAQGKFQNIT